MKPTLFSTLLAATICSAFKLGSNDAQWPASGLRPQNIPNHDAFGASSSYDAGLFTPLNDLSAVAEAEFMTLTHPAFPKHSVRIKKTKFCEEDNVGTYTGYIDVGARHLFFYFFESRDKPEKDDVIFWTNGGPGCPSSLGLLMELGPCRVMDGNRTVRNPDSWNNHANIFFVDQPIGVGFSYADFGESVGTTEEAAPDIASFVYVFFEHFTKFKGRAFHLAGESYAGRYLPIFAAHIHDQNRVLEEQGLTPINLKSVMIGNGYTHTPTMIESYYDMACTSASMPPVAGVRECVQLKQVQTRCRTWLKEACTDVFDAMACQAASEYCRVQMSKPIDAANLNPYDISKKCEGSLDDTLCYPVIQEIASYLDIPKIRALLGVDPSLSNQNFTFGSETVADLFVESSDILRSTHQYVASLLEHGIKVLIYVGKNDWICNHIGNLKWVESLDWSGREEFAKQKMVDWYLGGQPWIRKDPHRPSSKSWPWDNDNRAGSYKSYGGLTFLTIEGAGHMVPYDKPAESAWMVQQWTLGQEF